MESIYEAPRSELTDKPSVEGYGSLQRGIAGDYEFSIGNTISEAWERTKGAKGTLNLALFLYFILVVGLSFVGEAVNITLGVNDQVGLLLAFTFVQQLLMFIATTPLVVGLYILGLRRAVDAPISGTAIFGHYNKVIPLFLTMLLMYLMIMLGFLLLIIPGIYLAFAYYMALPLVVDKGLSPWQALEASRKAIGKRWFAVVGLMIVIGLLNLVAMIPLGIGLIWTAPMSIIAMGILYRNMFGCEEATAA